MPWIVMFALSLLSFILLCYAHSVAFGFICVLLTLGFLVAGVMKLIAGRMDDSSRDSGRIITAEELRMYREQAQARKQAAEASRTTPNAHAPRDASDPPPSGTT